MRKKSIGLGLGAVLMVTATASAELTDYIYLQNIEVRGTSGDLAIEVWPVSGAVSWSPGSAANPFGCASTGKWLIYPTTSAANRGELAKALQAAFLAGKKVRIWTSSNTCSGSGTSGYPTFYGVRFDRNEP